MMTLILFFTFFLSLVGNSYSNPVVGGYVMLTRTDSSGKPVGLAELQALAENAATIPVNRVLLGFFSPTIVYAAGTNSLANTGLNASQTGDYGFAAVKNYTTMLAKAGVDVFLSIGGWNYNCYPYFYMRYSVGGYGTNTPNYWKIQKYGNGDMGQCNEANQYCYVCEPPSEGVTLGAYNIFPEPSFSTTWQAAKQWVASGAGGSGTTPIWNEDMIPGNSYTDPKTGISTTVPGSGMYNTMLRDPYQDIVFLAKDLGATGIDLDYEEFWHADFFKTGNQPGPFSLTQTVFKYSAVAYDIATNIKNIQPSLKLSTAGSAVGAWSGNWWGGNLKGVWELANKWFPFIIQFMTTGANAGGINVMTYDLSKNTKFHECPVDGICNLDQQVQYYMSTYQSAGIPAYVGYEISTPAYPDKDEDGEDQLPLTHAMLSSIISQTQTQYQGGFMWELYKPVDSSDHATPTEVAQAICKAIMPSSPRCVGTIPSINPSPSGNVCTPGSCNVCDACCKSYITPDICDSCVAQECKAKNVCSTDTTCNTCSACCKSYLSGNQAACDACVSQECGSISARSQLFSGLARNVSPKH